MSNLIQTLWSHGSLSTMERLCLRSFMKNGHEVHLYVYDEVHNIPDGVIVKDGNEVLPQSQYDYKRFINNGTFADYFRYKLLLERGGWWVDTDLICVQPFSFPDEHVFGRMGPWFDKPPVQTRDRRLRRSVPLTTGLVPSNPETAISNNCMRAPAGSPIMKYMWQECCKHDPAKVQWSVEVGPMLVDRAVSMFNLQSSVRDTKAFNPVDYHHVRKFIDPTATWVFDGSVYAVHLWNDLWTGRTNWEDKHTWQITGCPPILQNKETVVEGSLYGDLVKKYL